MKNFLKQTKQIFFDNKEYFIRCTIITLIAGLILCISISVVVPASASDDTTESDQVIIPAGTYTFIDQPSTPTESFTIPLDFTSSAVIAELGINSVLNGTSIYVAPNISNSNFAMVYYGTFSPPIDGVTEGIEVVLESEFIIPSLKSITINVDSSVGVSFFNWFDSNTDFSPPTDIYTIEAGFYKARDSWNTSGFPITNDSINIRYYNDSINVQAYVEAEGIAFLRENDIVEIYYANSAVFTDGWNIDGAKNIQVLQDISVDFDFYTVFNNVFESSSQGSNEFESGYAAGYADGFLAGKDAGYNQGYYDGMTESSGNFFTDILGGVLGALDSFMIFGGFSLLDLLTTLLGGMALIWILKLLAGG